MPKVIYTIAAVNERLKAKGSKVRLEVRGKGSLNLRATLPPRPFSQKIRPHQQRIPLNLLVSETNIKKAEYEAEKLSGAIAFNTFSWANYAVAKTRDTTPLSETVELFRKHWFAQHDLTERTWQHNWARYYRRLPQDEPLSTKTMRSAIGQTPPNSVSRRDICRVYTTLCNWASVPCDFESLAGSKPKSKKEKSIPSDAELFETRARCKCATIKADAGWRWVYSIMLLAGLRPHEAFFCDWSEQGLEVRQGKTGPRTIFYETFELMYPGLLEEWDMKDIHLPDIDAENAYQKGTLGNKVCVRFHRWELPFSPYTLRHAFAIRASVTHGLPTAVAAALMGHSEAIHVREYHRWLSKEHSQNVLRSAIAQRKTV